MEEFASLLQGYSVLRRGGLFAYRMRSLQRPHHICVSFAHTICHVMYKSRSYEYPLVRPTVLT